MHLHLPPALAHTRPEELARLAEWEALCPAPAVTVPPTQRALVEASLLLRADRDERGRER